MDMALARSVWPGGWGRTVCSWVWVRAFRVRFPFVAFVLGSSPVSASFGFVSFVSVERGTRWRVDVHCVCSWVVPGKSRSVGRPVLQFRVSPFFSPHLGAGLEVVEKFL